MQKKALVTGGAGFIGLHLARELAKEYTVTIADNFERGKKDSEFQKAIENKNVSFLKIDLTNQNEFSELEKYDFVYHLAAINGTENFYKIPDKVIKVGIIGTINMLDWFIESKKGKLLFSSSSETYAGTLKLMKEKIGVTDENADYYIENVYDTIMALIRAKMFLRGFRASGNGVHEAEVSYTRKLKFTEQETRFLNEIRYWRNQIVYYGKELTKKYAPIEGMGRV